MADWPEKITVLALYPPLTIKEKVTCAGWHMFSPKDEENTIYVSFPKHLQLLTLQVELISKVSSKLENYLSL